MGSNFATDLAENIDLSLEQAIDFAHEDKWDETIEMPDGISYKGLTAAPVWAIIEQHHLDAWLPQDDEYYNEDNGYELGLGLE